MKIILLQNIKGVGNKYEVKDVSDGYANNFLIPKKLAEYASPKAVSKAEALKVNMEAEKEIRENLTLKQLEMLKGLKIVLTKKANEQGHLFEQVHAGEISEALKAQANIDIPAEILKIEKPIKETGEHEVVAEAGKNKEKFVVVVEGISP